MKKILILCTGNSCRSIIAEALINFHLSDCVKAYSAGVASSRSVNPKAINVLQQYKIWDNSYHSKQLDTMLNQHYDLVVTVCDNAQQSCPVFPGKTEVIHVGFADPDGQPYSSFIHTYHEIKAQLISVVKEKLC